MSTACLIGRPNGPAGLKAVYCHWDGNPSAMVPVLRRLVLWTFDGKPADAAHYLFRYSGFGYWASLTGSGEAYSSAMRVDTANIGPTHKMTGEPFPTDVDIYHDHGDTIDTVLECRGEQFVDSPLIHWPQQWLYVIYRDALAIARYVPPTEQLGNDVPLGIKCEPVPWSKSVNHDQLVEVERRADERVARAFAESSVPLGSPPSHLRSQPTRGNRMSEACTIEKPATVTDKPTIQRKPAAGHIEALWPLRAINSPHDGDGIEYAVLTVSHLGSRRAYFASLNREEHFTTSTRCKPFDAARVGGLTPVARFGQKSLEAAFDAALDTLRQEIADGDQKLVSYFTPSEGEAY